LIWRVALSGTRIRSLTRGAVEGGRGSELEISSASGVLSGPVTCCQAGRRGLTIGLVGLPSFLVAW
jgi:hypothetical protein